MNRLILIATSGALLSGALCFADGQVGTLTQLQGDVKVFSHPTKDLKNAPSNVKGAHVLYEGDYYVVNDAKSGDKVDNGNILRTAPGAKARVVFGNGDQLNVGSGTAYKIAWNSDSPKSETEMNLMYGKLRGIIEKGGPRSRLKIKTRSAVMGVRGTDFFIAEGANEGKTEIAIIRGSVSVAPVVAAAPDAKTGKKAPEPKPIEVKAGSTAEVGGELARELAKSGKVNPQIELRKTTQEEFSGIQKASVITPSKDATRTPADDKAQKEIEALEKKATHTTLNDIKTYDKKLFAQIEKQGKGVSLDVINQAAVQVLAKVAPKAPEKRKPYQSEIEDLETGAYDRYFKTID